MSLPRFVISSKMTKARGINWISRYAVIHRTMATTTFNLICSTYYIDSIFLSHLRVCSCYP
ncbi:uncharacterized protein PHALS_14599 [Plasmopara halstedii]|uniref:Uncharacterized protein n=1 Tax=Plasmopara halstedii TaxID=4781 RepID=A0A0P1AN81_PLAHL|nr:uncharacterized protein PHALS_14599 [Plasmopara halstedii]CEG42159.1 hypothetical protein PHALS_14599 [Plasmopara halstedii]|eukprot:XP_024578528.1 hypothetical protein PHALS_14599 [Plasmopara halstedii]